MNQVYPRQFPKMLLLLRDHYCSQFPRGTSKQKHYADRVKDFLDASLKEGGRVVIQNVEPSSLTTNYTGTGRAGGAGGMGGGERWDDGHAW